VKTKALLLAVAVAVGAGCSGGEEAVSVELEVRVGSRGMTAAVTDLGYTVTVTRFEVALRDLELTVGGETHEARARKRGGPLYHPGHSAGGDVTGELPGDFVIDFLDDGVVLGTATLLEGDYHGANFTFRADPALDGHTFAIEGLAARDGTDHPFTAMVDLEEETQLVGAPFEAVVTAASTEPLALLALTTDPFEPDTMFDGVDFAAEPAPVAIAPGQVVHNKLRRNLQVHDFYVVEKEPTP
jgi:hypothetical protein